MLLVATRALHDTRVEETELFTRVLRAVSTTHEFVNDETDVVQGVHVSARDVRSDVPQDVAQGVGWAFFLLEKNKNKLIEGLACN